MVFFGKMCFLLACKSHNSTVPVLENWNQSQYLSLTFPDGSSCQCLFPQCRQRNTHVECYVAGFHSFLMPFLHINLLSNLSCVHSHFPSTHSPVLSILLLLACYMSNMTMAFDSSHVFSSSSSSHSRALSYLFFMGWYLNWSSNSWSMIFGCEYYKKWQRKNYCDRV